MADEPISSFQLDRFRQLPVLAREVWQGGVVHLPAWIEGPPGAEPFRPFGVIWVSLSTNRMTMLIEPAPGSHRPDLVLRALLKFAQQEKKELGGRARRLLVGDHATREYLEQALGREAVTVEVVPRLDAVADVLREYTSYVVPDPVPAALDGKGVTPDVMRAFADAAARKRAKKRGNGGRRRR